MSKLWTNVEWHYRQLCESGWMFWNTEYRSNNFVIGLTNESPSVSTPTLWNYTVCGQYPGAVPSGGTVSLYCPNLPPFRFVIVQFPITSNMNFCELEVIAPGTSLSSLDSWNGRTGQCRTGRWRTKLLGWTLQNWTMTDWKMKDRQELIRRWDTRTWRDLSPICLLIYHWTTTHLYFWNIFWVTRTFYISNGRRFTKSALRILLLSIFRASSTN